MKGYSDIYWPEQCKYCKRLSLLDTNTEFGRIINEDCQRNQVFMQKLKGLYNEYLGTLDFKCDYFILDEDKYNEFKKSTCDDCNVTNMYI